MTTRCKLQLLQQLHPIFAEQRHFMSDLTMTTMKLHVI